MSSDSAKEVQNNENNENNKKAESVLTKFKKTFPDAVHGGKLHQRSMPK